MYKLLSGQLPQRKIAPWLGLEFGLGLGLEKAVVSTTQKLINSISCSLNTMCIVTMGTEPALVTNTNGNKQVFF